MNCTKRVSFLLQLIVVISAIVCAPIVGRSATPTITSLSPTSGAVGASVTITGTNYGSTQGTSTVKFNGTAATSIASWGTTSIVAVVPTGATTGNVVVTVSGTASNGVSFTVLATPTLTSLSPTSAAVGASVTLTGTNFGSTQGTGGVKFNGTAATSITSWSSTSIVAVVPTGATAGNVVVTASGVSTSGVSFTVLPTPTLTSLSPTSAAIGASVTLTGTNFGSTQGAGVVKFNGTTATSITSWSSTSIVAVVPSGATAGNVVVTASGVATSGISFTVLATPTLTSLSPSSAAVGASVTLTGTNFGSTQGTGVVKFNGTAASSITSWSSTSIVAVVPTGATTGNVVVTASGVSTGGVSFTVLPTPTLTSLSPTSGAVGSSVTLTGTNFGSTQGTGGVKFNGTAVTSVTSWSSTSIVVLVPTGASTGNVVVTASGVATSGVSFTVLPTPTITSLSPSSGAIGASVTITGTNYGSTQGTSTVKFNGTAATSITSWSSTSIVAVVPTGATTGNVVVTVSSVASSGTSFTVLPTPTLTSLSPTSGAVGSSVTLTGTNFGSTQGTGGVTFNGAAVTSVTSWASTSIVVLVPTGATTGNAVVTASGVATGGVSFTVLPTPTISSLSPTSGAVGASVTITGTNYGSTQGTSTVKFNGTTATSITSWSSTSIVAVVPTGATTGSVIVTVSAVASSGTSFTVLATPTLTSLSPTSAAVGASVTLTGTNFSSAQGAGGVTFNGTAVTSITSWSSTSIVALVPTGATTGNVVVTASGVATSGVSFTVLATPTLTSLSPTSAAVGASVTLTGTNFGSTQGTGVVKFNGTTATSITSWSSTSIVALVPTGATTGNVVVTASGVATSGVSFTVLPTPTLTGLSPTSAAVGASVTLTGTNFGSTQGAGVVKFNGTTATSITSWSSTSIVALVPTGATTGNVVVTASGVSTSGVSFTVLPTPTLTSLSPTSGAVGSSVTLTGTNFGSTQGTGGVKFNGTAVTSVTSWSSTSIVVLVPTGATTGNAVVTASGVPTSGVSFTVIPTAPTPTFSPVAGTYYSTQAVTISDSNSGATIYYTTNGTTPNTSSSVYSGAINVTSTETLEAMAVVSGYANSLVATAVYTIQAPTPTFSPVAGEYVGTQYVTISDSNSSATIYYTTDGTTPTTSSNVYNDGAVTVQSDETLKAIAVVSGYPNSSVATAVYTIQASPPTFSLAAGSYVGTQSVSLYDESGSGSKIYYTTNGSTPTTSSSRYSSAISVTASETIKAIATQTNEANSTVSSSAYTITSEPTTPTFSPVAGAYSGTQFVTINSSLNATIYYTGTSGTTGTTPTTSSIVYTGAISVGSTETIEAISVLTGYTSSAVATATFTLPAIASSTTALSLSSGGSPVTSVPSGGAVTLTATVASSGAAVTSGTVNFCDATATHCTDVHLLGTAQLTSAGTAAINLRPGIGIHTYRAIFIGTSRYTNSSSSPVQLTVGSSFPTITTIQEIGGSPGNYTVYANVAGIASNPIAPTGAVSIVDTSHANAVLSSGLLSTGTVPSLTFSNPVTISYPPTNENYLNLVTVGDFNGDGKPDLAVFSQYPESGVTILLGNGDGTFTPASGSPITTTYGPYGIAVGDFNGDGKLDLAILDANSQGYEVVTVLLGNGDGTFTSTASTLSACGGSVSLVVADFNKDGKLDLAVPCNNVYDESVYILLGNGDGTFTQSTGSPIPLVDTTSLAVTADFNGDGNPDLAVTNEEENTVTILLGNGDGTFAQPSGSPVPAGNEPYSLAAGDFNGDGKPDLAVADYNNARVTMLLGNGDGTFTQSGTVSVGRGPISLAVGDFNKDGKEDLAVANNYDGTVSILTGNGNGTFSLNSLMTVNTGSYEQGGFGSFNLNGPSSLAVGDFNGTGILDVAVVNPGPETTSALNILQTNLSEGAETAVIGVAPVGLGVHNIEAIYSGDSNFAPSTSATVPLQTVPDFGLATLVPSESWFGYPVTVNIKFLPLNGFLPTGTVSCSGANVTSAVVTLNQNGAAAVPINGLPLGKDPIVCTFVSSSPNFSNGASSPLIESVIPAPENGSVTITPASATLHAGQTLQFSATVFNTANPVLSWSVSPSGAGTISATGLYTAPATVSSAQTIAVTAINQASTSQLASAVITLSPPPCASSGYGYQRSIVISHTNVPNTDQADFPFLFNTTDPAFKTTANGGHVSNSNGYDLIFSTDPAGLTKLDHELEQYNPATGQVVAWVRIPTLSHTTDTVLYVFYGNSSIATSQQNPTGVWDSNHTAVYHLANAGAGIAADSTANGHNGTLSSVSAATGEIAGGASLNGTSSYIQIPTADFPSYPNSGSTTTGFSASFGTWFKTASTGVLLGQTDGTAPGGNPGGWQPALFIDTGGRLRASIFSHGSVSDQIVTTTAYNDNNWHFAVDTYANGTELLYVDGQFAGSQQVTETGYNSAYAYFIGSGETANWPASNGSWLYFNGTVDEVNVSNVARSSDWVQTEYSNQSAPSTFYALYPENAQEIIPSAVSLSGSQSQQFTVLGSTGGSCSSPSVIWAMPAGLPGTLTAGGLYTAPNSIDTQQTISINGITLGDTTQTLATTVTLVPAATESVTPGSVVLSSGQTQQFTANVNNTGNAAVAWTIDPAGTGSFNTTGMYTAPASVTTEQTVTVTATSVANSSQWASATITLSPTTVVPIPPSPPQCGSSGYNYQRIIVIDHTKIPNTDQANFPFLFNTTDPALATTGNGGNVTSPSGYDIIFSTDPNGLSQLDYEIETYNPSSGQVVAWVRIPTLSHTTDTILYMFYGNPNVIASQQNPSGVWDGNYQAVYHLANTGTGVATDSTGLANNAQLTSVSAAAGQIDGAGSFNGTASYMQIPSTDFLDYPIGTYPSSASTNNYAASFGVWFKTTSAGVLLSQTAGQVCADFCEFQIGTEPGAENMDGWNDALYVDDAGLLRANIFTTGSSQIVSTTAYNDNNWHFAVLTYGNQTQTLYVDGRIVGSESQVDVYGYDSSYAYFVGTGYTQQVQAGNWDWLYFNGTLDEVSVSTIARSSDWVQTEYNNQRSPSTFYAFYSPTAVLVVPSAVSLYGSQSQQFAATASCNTTLSWSIPSGAPGSLTSNGLYTAPLSVTTQQTVAVTASSQPGGTIIGSAVVTLLPQPPPIALSASAQPPYTTGSTQGFTATLLNQDGSPEVGVDVTFAVVGANSNTASATTNLNGIATFTYNGANTGNDTIQATAVVGGQIFTSQSVSVSWVAPGPLNPDGTVTLMAPPNLGEAGLVGAFTNNAGTVIEPISIGATTREFVVPTGATQLQLGVDDNHYADNGGSGFAVAVNGVSGTIPSTTAPWKWITGGLNNNYQFGMGDGTNPIVTTGLTAGQILSVAYQSGAVSVNPPSSPLVNANGDPTWITGVTLWQGAYFPTMYTTLSSYPVGQPIQFSVLVTNGSGTPVSNVSVTLNVTGANVQQLQSTTDSTGTAVFMYVGTNAGTDNLQAQANPIGVANIESGSAIVTWVNYATPPAAGSLALSSIAVEGSSQGFEATATDASSNPLYNANVGFYVSGAQALSQGSTTDTTGHADFEFNHTNSGTLNIIAVDTVNRNVAVSNLISGPWPIAPPTTNGPNGTITIAISANGTVNLPNNLQLNGTVTDSSLPPGSSPTIAWTEVSGPGTVTFATPNQAVTTAAFSEIGNYVLQLSANDLVNSGSLQFPVTVSPPLQDPQGWIGSPAYSSTVNGLVPIALASGVTLQSGVLSYAPVNNVNNFTVLNANTTGSGQIGTLDTTTLANGSYWIQLQGTNSTGNFEYSLVMVTVAGNYKPGRGTATVTDLVVPATGIAISIQRQYDSLNAATSGDFGFGWSLGINTNLTVDPLGNVTFTLGGQRRTFYLTPQPLGSVFSFLYQPEFTAEPGFNGSLSDGYSACTGSLDLIVPGGSLWFCPSGSQYVPTEYIYTDPNGTAYTISAAGSLQSIQDRSGNGLTITANGITSTTGLSVPFVRDSNNRITQITDPQGNNYLYTYDTNGNLATVTYPNTTTPSNYSYDTSHRYLSGTDARSNPLPTSTYYTASQTDPNGFPLNGRLESVSDALGETTSYAYNLATNTTTVTYPHDAGGNIGTATMVYDSYGMLLSSTDPLGHTTTNVYDANHNLISVTDPLSHTNTYTYDQNGNKTSSTYPATPTSHNTTRTTQYNPYGAPISTTDELGNVRSVNYDANYNPSSVTDSAGALASFLFNQNGTLAAGAVGYDITANPAQASQFAYDSNGNIASSTDALGRTTSYSYDSLARRLSMSVPPPTLGNGAPTSTTTYQYDALGDLTQSAAPLGRVTSSQFDANGNRISSTDARGNITTYQYDALNRLSSITYPTSPATTATLTYDFRNNVVSETKPDGHVTRLTYDLAGRLVSVTHDYGTSNPSTITYAYNADGRMQSQTDALGHATTYTYDAAGRLTAVAGVKGNVQYGYDDANHRTSITDANSNTTQFQYDVRNRMIKRVYPNSTYKTYSYDGPGNLVSETDQAGNTVQYTYDATSQLKTVVQLDHPNSSNNTNAYGYDSDGNLTSVADESGHTTQDSFDLLYEPISKTLPDGSLTETKSYDAAGNLLSLTHFNGKTTTYAFDGVNRLLTRTPDPSLNESTATFTYTASGKFATSTDASGTTTYTYGSLGRLMAKATPEGTLNYTYDAAGHVASIVSSNPNGASVSYTYDTLNRLSTVVDNRLPSGQNTTTYTYDPASNLATATYPNGLQSIFNYDSLNRLTAFATPVSGYTYQLGPTGNRTSANELNGRTLNWSYDGIYRLTNETISADPSNKNGVVSYSLDPVGNRLTESSSLSGVNSGTFSYSVDDQLSTESYDSNGNTLATGGNAYGYDSENRLTSMNSGAVSIVYDAFGNRVAKTVNGVTTGYLVEDDVNPTGLPQVMDEIVGGVVQREYAYGLQRISENQVVSGSWTPSFYGYDGAGSVRQLTNSAGAVTDTYEYDAFGNEVNHTGTTPNNYLFRSEQYDPDLSFYYLRARYLNPVTGRFLSRDPNSGHFAIPATLHKYLYASADPVNRIDPNGRADTGEVVLEDAEPEVAEGGERAVAQRVNCILNTAASALNALTAIEAGNVLGSGGAAYSLAENWEACSGEAEAGGEEPSSGAGGGEAELEAGTCPLCFAAGTPVHTNRGDIPIEKIEAGDEVVSRNRETGALESKPVTALIPLHKGTLLEIRVEGEREPLRPSVGHPFWVRRGDVQDANWTEAGKMQVGDLVQTIQGNWRRVVAITPLEGQETVYNFTVDKDHDYFVGETGFLVHNKSCGCKRGFRAVHEKELYDINDFGGFRAAPGGTEGKYFFNTVEQAWNLGNRMYGNGNFGVVQGDFPCGVPFDPLNPATEGPGFFIGSGDLPTGVPTILWP